MKATFLFSGWTTNTEVMELAEPHGLQLVSQSCDAEGFKAVLMGPQAKMDAFAAEFSRRPIGEADDFT